VPEDAINAMYVVLTMLLVQLLQSEALQHFESNMTRVKSTLLEMSSIFFLSNRLLAWQCRLKG
jgi:hypothetical protein